MKAIDPSPLPRVIIAKRMARPFFAHHPWVFAGSIAKVEGQPIAGGEVRVESSEGQFIGRGVFNPTSAIRVRLYRWDDVSIDTEFWRGQIQQAVSLRTQVLNLPTDRPAYRLIYSESDGLSGLTVDRYDRWLVAQVTSLAVHDRLSLIVPILRELEGIEGIVVRTERSIAAKEGLTPLDEVAWGTVPTNPVVVVENEIEYEVSLSAGQKTGFYCDQRDNRRAAAIYSPEASVLDLFCFTGSFGLNALKHGRSNSVYGIDSSASAINAARRNAERNGFNVSQVEYEVADVFQALERLRSDNRRFGKVICDPPKFAQRSAAIPEALKGYLRLNRAAVEVLEPGGVLLTCSCSGLIDRPMMAEMLSQVAELSGRSIQILEIRSQAADHPISVSCPETGYLKCFICRVG